MKRFLIFIIFFSFACFPPITLRATLLGSLFHELIKQAFVLGEKIYHQQNQNALPYDQRAQGSHMCVAPLSSQEQEELHRILREEMNHDNRKVMQLRKLVREFCRKFNDSAQEVGGDEQKMVEFMMFMFPNS